MVRSKNFAQHYTWCAADNCLEVLLCASHLEEWHTTLTGVAFQLAAMLCSLAHAVDLLITCSRVDHHDPLTFGLTFNQHLFAIICHVVVEHWNTCDELGAASC